MEDRDHLPEIILFVKAGADGKRYGACPFCQRIFMILMHKSQEGLLHFKVATVNLSKPPEEFKKAGLRRIPAIISADGGLDNVDDIVDYLDANFPSTSLAYDNSTAEISCKDIFQKFCFFIKEVSKDSASLAIELKRLNQYIVNTNTKFLCSDHLCHLDCEVLPKIHHVRIATMYLKNYKFPDELIGLKTYLTNAYNHEIFIKTCPSDQEIVFHWADKPETPTLSHERHSQMIKEEPKYTFALP
ncbi:CLIC6 [Cordylochernes scorpioides]|uniref:CLIC6 n=1 Tax=Cordylochernes scorpioides TaxID=51811 RepID=A0ABY6KNC9_9ARAC|nr:CLIC6 [Cordylochernes scorpioides]UYV68655.1 CLIC6 [Cordylochernes scorpioides]